MSLSQEVASDHGCEDIFMGPLTLEEIKYRVSGGGRHTFGYSKNNDNDMDNNRSLRLIETHSTPNLLHGSSSQQPVLHQFSPDVSSEAACTFTCDITTNDSDDSFLRLEVETSANNDPIQLLLPNIQDNENASPKSNHTINKLNHIPEISTKDCIDKDSLSKIINTNKTPLKTYVKVQEPPKSLRKSPREVFSTPSQVIYNKTPFKTPGTPMSQNKLFVTPSKKFQHIKSPVAAYINESPVTPLVREVHPKKHLHGVSSIPKPVKSASQKTETNKENVNQDDVKLHTTNNVKLPLLAYRSAKKTEVIHIPDKKKMPHSQWAKKVESSIPRALVLRHQHREMDHLKKPLSKNVEDSFADLSLHQADLSVCTEKSAFNKH